MNTPRVTRASFICKQEERGCGESHGDDVGLCEQVGVIESERESVFVCSVCLCV